jgi:hypothetical protein
VLIESRDENASQLALDRANGLIHPKAKTATAVTIGR